MRWARSAGAAQAPRQDGSSTPAAQAWAACRHTQRRWLPITFRLDDLALHNGSAHGPRDRVQKHHTAGNPAPPAVRPPACATCRAQPQPRHGAWPDASTPLPPTHTHRRPCHFGEHHRGGGSQGEAGARRLDGQYGHPHICRAARDVLAKAVETGFAAPATPAAWQT